MAQASSEPIPIPRPCAIRQHSLLEYDGISDYRADVVRFFRFSAYSEGSGSQPESTSSSTSADPMNESGDSESKAVTRKSASPSSIKRIMSAEMNDRLNAMYRNISFQDRVWHNQLFKSLGLHTGTVIKTKPDSELKIVKNYFDSFHLRGIKFSLGDTVMILKDESIRCKRDITVTKMMVGNEHLKIHEVVEFGEITSIVELNRGMTYIGYTRFVHPSVALGKPTMESRYELWMMEQEEVATIHRVIGLVVINFTWKEPSILHHVAVTPEFTCQYMCKMDDSSDGVRLLSTNLFMKHGRQRMLYGEPTLKNFISGSIEPGSKYYEHMYIQKQIVPLIDRAFNTGGGAALGTDVTRFRDITLENVSDIRVRKSCFGTGKCFLCTRSCGEFWIVSFGGDKLLTNPLIDTFQEPPMLGSQCRDVYEIILNLLTALTRVFGTGKQGRATNTKKIEELIENHLKELYAKCNFEKQL